MLTENGENNSCSEEHVSSVVAQRSRERKGQKGHLSKVLTSAEKLLRFGVGGNKLLSSFNQVIYPHSDSPAWTCLDALSNPLSTATTFNTIRITHELDNRSTTRHYIIL